MAGDVSTREGGVLQGDPRGLRGGIDKARVNLARNGFEIGHYA